MVDSGPFVEPLAQGLAPAGERREATASAAGAWRVVLADRYAMVRAAIAALLGSSTGLEVVGQAASTTELLSLVERARPDLVLTELSLADGAAFGAIEAIHRRQPGVRLLALSGDERIEAVKHAIACGACGYLTKRAPSYELETAVRSVMTRGCYWSSLIAQRLLDPPQAIGALPLTPRQVQILTLIAEGRSTRQIAGDLGLSTKTVDVHRGRIMDRLELSDVASLTRYALRSGLVTFAAAGPGANQPQPALRRAKAAPRRSSLRARA